MYQVLVKNALNGFIRRLDIEKERVCEVEDIEIRKEDEEEAEKKYPKSYRTTTKRCDKHL